MIKIDLSEPARSSATILAKAHRAWEEYKKRQRSLSLIALEWGHRDREHFVTGFILGAQSAITPTQRARALLTDALIDHCQEQVQQLLFAGERPRTPGSLEAARHFKRQAGGMSSRDAYDIFTPGNPSAKRLARALDAKKTHKKETRSKGKRVKKDR